jgi:hypothetical protein
VQGFGFRFNIWIAFTVSCFCGDLAAQSVSATKAKDSDPITIYKSAEIRHHINTYYQEKNYLRNQEPSLHARLQLGANFYENMLDLYGTIGVYKLPKTQQIRQRRTEIALDVHAVTAGDFSLLIYNIVQLPLQGNESDGEFEDSTAADEKESYQDGTIYTFGLMPTYKNLLVSSGFQKWKILAGGDAWTRFYSRKQFTGEYDLSSPKEDLALASQGETTQTTEAAEIEDFAQHYDTEVYLGSEFEWSTFFKMKLTGNYHSHFRPTYLQHETGVDVNYAAERYSYYRLRLHYRVNERVALINDFYHFHGGLFEDKKRFDDRRFRNIARVTCRL